MALMSNEQANEWIDKTVLYLAHYENAGRELSWAVLAESLEIPYSYRQPLLGRLRNSGFADSKPVMYDPKVKINEKGRLHANEIDKKYFELKGVSFLDKSIDMKIEETCELIFQAHKNNNGSLMWTKETFKPPRPNNISAAKALMLHDGVIIVVNSIHTTLSSVGLKSKSYTEAVEILSGKTSEPTNKTINVYGNVNDSVLSTDKIENSKNDMSDSFNKDFNKEVTKNITNANSQKPFWRKIGSFIISNIWTIILALLIAYLIFRFGWN